MRKIRSEKDSREPTEDLAAGIHRSALSLDRRAPGRVPEGLLGPVLGGVLDGKERQVFHLGAAGAGGAGAEKADRWKLTDPIPRLRQELIQQGILTEVQAAEIERDAKQTIDDAATYAIESPYPALEELYTDIFA